MRVKVGDTWYDSKHQPICIQVSEREQEFIGSMDRSIAKDGKFGAFPKGTAREECFEFMKE